MSDRAFLLAAPNEGTEQFPVSPLFNLVLDPYIRGPWISLSSPGLLREAREQVFLGIRSKRKGHCFEGAHLRALKERSVEGVSRTCYRFTFSVLFERPYAHPGILILWALVNCIHPSGNRLQI